MGRRSPLARPPSPTSRGWRGIVIDQVTKAVPGLVVLATDTYVYRKHASISFLATTGHTGLRAHLYPEHLACPRTRVTFSELCPFQWELKNVLATRPGNPVEVRVDSLDAHRYLRAWQNGGTRMPEGYETGLRSRGRTPSLVQLQMCVEYAPNLTFVHEKAHIGNALNKAADSLAKLGLRTVRGIVPPDGIPRLAPCGLPRRSTSTAAPPTEGPSDDHPSRTTPKRPAAASGTARVRGRRAASRS
ncbi:hypothetical protein [Streptomyces incanus]|uniref:RNase H type-1 domain-containing protein n=1 Tax=Streptomyces incanus TaxID=887453 RepID=A0ABW0XW26_9ACTN